MKRIFYLSMLLLLTFSVVKAESPYSFNGIYTDVDNYREIVVKSYKRGIKVRGIHRQHPNKWVKFERENRSHFVDCDGNHVELVDRRRGTQIIYKSRRGHTRVFQEGIIRPSYGGSCSSGGYNNSYHEEGRGFGYYNDRDSRNGQHNDRGYQRNDTYSNHRDRADSYSFEGTYESEKGRKVAILTTRSGFKAKFSGERVWKSYAKVNDRFEDRDGNYYVLTGQDHLQWVGKYSGKTRQIKKVSDEVSY